MKVLRAGYFLFSLIITLNLFSNTALAQTFHKYSYGVEGGISIPNLSGGNNPQTQGYTSRLGPFAGINSTYSFSRAFGIEAGLNFVAQGGKKSGTQTTVVPGQAFNSALPTGASYTAATLYKNKSPLNYLELPLLAKFSTGQGTRFFADAGPYAGLLLSARQITKSTTVITPNGSSPALGQGPVTADSSSSIKDRLKNFTFGIQAGIGVEHQFGKVSVFLETHFELGLTDIQKYPADDGKNHTGAVIVALGFRY